MATETDWYQELLEVERELTARAPESAPQPSLDRVRALADLMGGTHQAYPVVHLTGTNGKTTTSRITEAVLRAHGLKTGGFTSPHLQSLVERVTIDGQPLSAERFVQTYRRARPYLDEVDRTQPIIMSYFEAFMGVVFAALADAKIDVGIIEVGLGGAWDATNIVDSAVSVITPIDLDHQKFLGSTRAEIAREKAGIIKPGSTVVIARQVDEVRPVLTERVEQVGATAYWEDRDFAVLSRTATDSGQTLEVRTPSGAVFDGLELPLHGAHQAQNAAVALAAAEALLAPRQPLDPERVRAGIAAASSPGRLEVVASNPLTVIDAAHNPAGAHTTAQGLIDAFPGVRFTGVVAILADKDVKGILTELEPVLDQIIITTNSSPRALPADQLTTLATTIFGPDRVHTEPTLERAIDLARHQISPPNGGVLITGSIVTAGEARTILT
ncbi:bifunctional folylpolyglutamate synthase/dihydrofolate synthase [Nocardia terpenica]|uniref:bifunctional folylpolyglutamate synthase/dihydrofolate synthase n=1 Tax=Nocardia terpenica TaxID=455432 RepID=UPI001894208E|nr:folylpolyglutamate synthase/dihydrofolate synthase family protein [Nocardia terpenica]MBF6063319.1 bifunctional folylpolyglutamate synthase/dihydrofolate synthase [Nocardia terpenica]MBF6105875.1 bifunctional folylpolyglutamate synthase/dihydrofolate synthase [Nocardia terpenica]MBF6113541.1 bifunctional folylpolyglutamate synthase/dihydrofolate synthase [Nocardia terpenica]MBF6119616.1 bifunctional folylpolyglutamate synthase/dihydrofolate synthase [Nocardia terpenica]MBF6152027.1 bifuncti